MDSVRRLFESLDRDDQENADRISQLESLVRQLQFLLNRWEMLIESAVDIMSVRTYAHSVPCAWIRINLNT